MNIGSRIAAWFGGENEGFVDYIEKVSGEGLFETINTEESDELECVFYHPSGGSLGPGSPVFGRYTEEPKGCKLMARVWADNYLAFTVVNSASGVKDVRLFDKFCKIFVHLYMHDIIDDNGEYLRRNSPTQTLKATATPVLLFANEGRYATAGVKIKSFMTKKADGTVKADFRAYQKDGVACFKDVISGEISYMIGNGVFNAVVMGGYKCLISSLKSLCRRFLRVLRNPTEWRVAA